jgi:hypothetical protein
LLAADAAPARVKVAVLDLKAVGVDPAIAENVSEFFTASIDDLGCCQVISRAEISAMLGFEKEKPRSTTTATRTPRPRNARGAQRGERVHRMARQRGLLAASDANAPARPASSSFPTRRRWTSRFPGPWSWSSRPARSTR